MNVFKNDQKYKKIKKNQAVRMPHTNFNEEFSDFKVPVRAGVV